MSGTPVTISRWGAPVSIVDGDGVADSLTVTATGGNTYRSLADWLGDDINAKGLGAVDGGVTNNKTAIDNAIALGASRGGGVIQFPAGVYNIDVATTTLFTLGSSTHDKIVIRGMGMALTTLKITVNDAAYHILFDVAATDITFEDMTIEVVRGGSAGYFTLSLMRQYSENLKVNRVRMKGAMVDSAGLNHAVFPIQYAAATGAQKSKFRDCEFIQVSYNSLKNDTDTSVQYDMDYQGCLFKDTFGGLHFNSPKGNMRRIRAVNNTFDGAPWPTAAAAGQFMFSVASCQEVICTGNHFTGTCHHAIHIEEATDLLIIENNTLYIDANDGMQLFPNNLGTGSYLYPQRIRVAGNHIVKSGSTGAGTGIQLGNTGHAPSLSKSICEGNIVSNWTYGIVTDAFDEDAVAIRNNTITSCTNGLYAVYGLPSIEGNTMIDCTTGLRGISGGCFGKNKFQNCTTAWVAVSNAFMMLGFQFVILPFAHAGGGATTYVSLTPASKTAFAGRLQASANVRAGGSLDRGISEYAPTLTTAGVFTANLVMAHAPGNAAGSCRYNANALEWGSYLIGTARTVAGTLNFDGSVMVLV